MIFLVLLNLLTVTIYAADWRTADRSSAKIAPLPAEHKEAVVQVYAARTFNWHKYLAVHSWIAFKEKDAKEYDVFHVMGWNIKRNGKSISEKKDFPDRKWFGSTPVVIQDLRGKEAEAAIPKIRQAIENYPYPDSYRMFPGPNSNTFIAYIIRHTDELKVELPPNAVGKDWINDGDIFAFSETGSGVQFSLLGLLGFTLGVGEGVEINVLGLSFGVDIFRPALKLPGVGRLGMKDSPVL